MRLLQKDFPDARIVASTFDAFARPLTRAVRDGLRLPVVWEEIGDTCARPSARSFTLCPES